MTVAAQHALDFAAILADPSGPAVDAVVGSVPLRLIREPGGLVADPATGVVQVERETVYCLLADVALSTLEAVAGLGVAPPANSELLLDGERWIVEAVPWKGPVLQLSMMRYVG